MRVLPVRIFDTVARPFAGLPRTGRIVVLLLAMLAALSPAPALAKYASMVINADTGEVLHETNPDTRNFPASLTKMMTLYLMFESIEEGRMRLDDKIVMTSRAANQPPSKLGLKPNETLRVEDAIRALAVKSANDVAAAVAEHMAGSEPQFALRMTAKARQLGMSNTTFRNASGLPHRAQMSTARDMAKLAHALIRDYPRRYHYFSEPNFEFDGKTHRTHNALLTDYEGADGIKTGYIRASGFNLVASVKRGDKRLIGVVFGARDSKSRNLHMVNLLDKGWAKVYPQALAVAKTKKVEKAEKTAKLDPGSKPKASGESVWGVQVGAFKDREPAYDLATRAVGVAPTYLANGEVTVSPLEKKSGSILYRGRIQGITKTQAYRACRELKKKKFGCMPFKLSETMEVASLN
ncbi:MAG: D-alanyl-D-alanine carboxypeptidase [Alphaproteobacteria bacterium]|nr:D-alanyl-D-alanine carboxypeptidase [Alphaproteobacteria bacterium]